MSYQQSVMLLLWLLLVLNIICVRARLELERFNINTHETQLVHQPLITYIVLVLLNSDAVLTGIERVISARMNVPSVCSKSPMYTLWSALVSASQCLKQSPSSTVLVKLFVFYSLRFVLLYTLRNCRELFFLFGFSRAMPCGLCDQSDHLIAHSIS